VPEPFTGADELPLRRAEHQRARRVWHQVLVWYMATYGGDSVDTLAGNIGWYYLRLTHAETADLFRSASGDPGDPIELRPGQSGTLTESSQGWRATGAAVRRGKPRGAYWRDLFVKAPAVGSTWTRRLLGLVTSVGVVLAAAGLAIRKHTPESLLVLAAAVWLICLALAVAVLRDQGDMTAAADAWPRLRYYRPARWSFEHARLRAPAPYLLIALASIGLALFVLNLLHARHTLRSLSFETAWWAAGILAGVAVIAYAAFARRAARLWATVQAERRRRRPLNERGPQP
jgi:hypothetical protein